MKREISHPLVHSPASRPESGTARSPEPNPGRLCGQQEPCCLQGCALTGSWIRSSQDSTGHSGMRCTSGNLTAIPNPCAPSYFFLAFNLLIIGNLQKSQGDSTESCHLCNHLNLCWIHEFIIVSPVVIQLPLLACLPASQLVNSLCKSMKCGPTTCHYLL